MIDRSAFKIFLAVSLIFTSAYSCVDKVESAPPGELLIDTTDRFSKANSAGNLLTTAVKIEGEFDMVFLPSEGLQESEYALIEAGMDDEEVERRVLRLYKPKTKYDKLMIGSMRGSTIKKFVINRSLEKNRHDLHVAGLRYYARIVGGLPQIYNVELENGDPIQDSRYYRIAVSEGEFFGSFPGYRFRHDFDRGLRVELGAKKDFFATDYLKSYLKRISDFRDFNDPRSEIVIANHGVVDQEIKISDIQGITHISPYQGKLVTTTGVITLSGYSSDEGVYEFYLQASEDDWDDDPRTSEGLLVRIRDVGNVTHGLDLTQRSTLLDGQKVEKFTVGQKVKLTGVVYEDYTSTGLTRTSLSEIESFEVLADRVALPRPIYLSGDSDAINLAAQQAIAYPLATEIPNEVISSYRGNLNQKNYLNLGDGIDFWESVEGMRVLINQPRVVGLNGGQKDFSIGQGDTRGAKQYMDIYLVAKDTASKDQITLKGGIQINQERDDFNPEIIKMTDHHFNGIVDTNYAFEIGDQFNSDLIGVMGYDVNAFGGGEYVFFIGDEAVNFGGLSKFRSLEEKPRSTLVGVDNQLTVATFNVENLAADENTVEEIDPDSNELQRNRVSEIGRSIVINLRCPDILNLVEIQDNNGEEFSGSASADQTLQVIIDAIVKENESKAGTEFACSTDLDYRFIEIPPKQNQEGGQPGGNIRVAMLYNAARVGFTPKGQAGALDETYITEDGSLSQNPGRVFPNDPRFDRTRKSLAAEFVFRGEKVFVIGNHFNSKGGDTSNWAAVQPPVRGSEERRSGLADGVNDFVELILNQSPKANIVVLGDFNEFDGANPMKVLEDNDLRNLMTYQMPDGSFLLDPADRYTYNFAGNSQPLDFVFASRGLLEKAPEFEVPHINTDYMRQVADHDPAVSRFSFD